MVFVGGVGTGEDASVHHLGMACRVWFVTAAEPVTLLVEARQQDRLARELASSPASTSSTPTSWVRPRSTRPGPTCCSGSSASATTTDAGAWWCRRICRSRTGPRSSSTRRRPPWSSTGSSTTRPYCRPRAAASGWRPAKQNHRRSARRELVVDASRPYSRLRSKRPTPSLTGRRGPGLSGPSA